MRTQLTLELIASYAYAWPYPVAALALLVILKIRAALQTRVDALQGAAWELVRLMENTTPDGPRERARVAEATAERFAVTGNAGITRPSLITGDAPTTDLTAAGLSLMERHANDAAKFRSFRSALRGGIAIFLSLMIHRNSQSAWVAMTEYMRRQHDRADAPNFAELKMALGLPPAWPYTPARHRMTRWNEFAIEFAMRQRRKVLSGLEYHPPAPEGSPPIVVTGDNILMAMRAYLHTSNTYDMILAPPTRLGGAA